MIKLCRSLFLFLGPGPIKWLSIGVSTGLILAIIEILFSSYILIILNAIGISDIKPPSIFGYYEISESMETGLIIFCLLGVLRALFQALKGISVVSANELFVSRLKLSCLNSIIHEKEVSISLSKINSLFAEIFTKAALFFHAAGHSIPLFVQAFVILASLFFISIEYTIFGVLYILLSGLIIFSIQAKVQKVVSPMVSLNSELYNNITRIIKNLFLIKVLRVEKSESSKFSKSLIHYTNRTLNANFLSLLSEGMPSFFGVLMIVGFIFAHSNYELIDNALFVSFLYLFLRFVQLLGQFTNFLGMANINWPHFIDSWNYFKRLNHLEVNTWTADLENVRMFSSKFDKFTHERYVESAISNDIESYAPGIVVNNLCFKYDNSQTRIFDNLNFIIKSGEQFALVGESGSGKSTLLSLLTGMLLPNSGGINIFGKAPLEYLDTYSHLIGYSGTDPFLFKGTLRDNLLYGNNTATSDDEIISSLKELNLNTWLESISFDLDYVITENAASLSTGQKQRLSIARALLRKPKLLILDEVSSNLDIGSENALVEIILKLKGEVTTIIVSHRINLIKHADQVIDVSEVNESIKY